MRKNAETTLINFRKSQNVLPACRYILLHSNVPAVQFHVASTIKEAVVREYPSLNRNDIVEWRSLLIQQLHQPILPFARETLAQALAVIVKRSWLDSTLEEKQDLFHRATELLNGDIHSVSLIKLVANFRGETFVIFHFTRYVGGVFVRQIFSGRIDVGVSPQVQNQF
jgi:hypothetical protein